MAYIFSDRRRPVVCALLTLLLIMVVATRWVVRLDHRRPSRGPQPALLPQPAEARGSPHESRRARMVRDQLVARGIHNARVLWAMGKVPRHEFVPSTWQDYAYADSPLPIGYGQTISQPYIVALMTEVVGPQPEHRVLEIGTGSGYQAAVLAELVQEVYTIEIEAELAAQADARLRQLGYHNVHVRAGDGYLGWPEAAPFDAILVTCGADHVPPALVEQLKPGGKLVMPVGGTDGVQWLRVVEKHDCGHTTARDLLPVRFVPLRR